MLAKTSERQWIRGLDAWQDDSALDADALRGMHVALAGRLDARTAEMIEAWRRAALSTEPASAVVALAESLEFYVAGTSVPSLLSAEHLQMARGAVRDAHTWSSEQQERLSEVMSKANDAPFFIRLRAAVTDDGLALTKAEFGLLRKMRDQRNDLLHGRERVDPSPDDLTAAVALVGRLLTSRLAKLPGPS